MERFPGIIGRLICMRDLYKQISRFKHLSPHSDERLIVSSKDAGRKNSIGCAVSFRSGQN